MKKELQKTIHTFFLFILLSVTAASYGQIGSLDSTFDPDEGPDFQVNAAELLPDGKIIIGGNFAEYNTVSRKGIARINADGTLDTSFNPGTGIPVLVGSSTIGIQDLKVQPDGKILIGGSFDTYNDIEKNDMARLNADGSLDGSFTLDTRITNIVDIKSIAVQPDGKIIITGSFKVSGTNQRGGIARINADGTLDENFSPYITYAGTSNPDFHCTLLQPDGKILVGGSLNTTGTTYLKLARLNADGSRDLTFTPITNTIAGVMKSIALQPDGKIVIGGGFDQMFGTIRKNNFARLNTDGTLDTSFDTGTGTGISVLNRVLSIQLQPDGKMIIAGGFSVYNGVARRGIARINANGTLDTSFIVGTGLTITTVNDAALFDDGSVLVAGNFTSYNGNTRNRIAKISTRTINVISLSETGPFCAGAAFNLNYTPVGTYNAGNVFTAQLSDASGDFSTPTAIGTLSSAVAGTINVTLPQNTLAGTGYKIRVISTSPVVTGDIFATAVVINTTPAPTAVAQSFCASATVNDLQVTLATNAVKKWYATATSTEVLLPTVSLTPGNYYVTQTLNGCESSRVEVAVTINTATLPDFITALNVCMGSNAPTLSLTSPNGITGTWSPATISNTIGGSYVFTPNVGQCASPVTLTTTITAVTTPNFAQIPAICSGTTAPILALTSPNGITGTWSPATISNTIGGSYVFTPNAGQCASTLTLTTTITSSTTPNFAQIPAFCSGTTTPLLALTSPNGITGTWSPATISNTIGGNYVFTPNAGQCASTLTLTTIVTTTLPPTGNATQDFTTGQTLASFNVVGTSIKWYDAPTGGNELPNTTLIVSGTVYYASQTVNGCESPTRLPITAGIDLSTDTFETSQLKYYPNPVSDFLSVNYSEDIDTIAIYNLLGQTVLLSNPKNTTAKIDVSLLNSGTYLLNITVRNATKTVKFIKQ